MSSGAQRAIEELLRAQRIQEFSAEVYAVLKAAEPLLKYRDADLHGRVVDLISKIEGWK